MGFLTMALLFSIVSCPSVSDSCAWPEIINCALRLFEQIRSKRDRSEKSNSGRLYRAKRRDQTIVQASGSSITPVLVATKFTSCSRSSRLIFQIVSSADEILSFGSIYQAPACQRLVKIPFVMGKRVLSG